MKTSEQVKGLHALKVYLIELEDTCLFTGTLMYGSHEYRSQLI